MGRRLTWKDRAGIWAIMLGFLWVMSAFAVFRFRHPWATETECFLNSWTALTYGRVDYDQARPREQR